MTTPKVSAPVVGFNHNLKHGGRIYHVQTEDSGLPRAHFITHLYIGGNILGSMKGSYTDLAEDPEMLAKVRKRMEEQHKNMVRRLVAGEFAETAAKFSPHYEPGVLASGHTGPAAVNTEHAEAPEAGAAVGPAAFIATPPLQPAPAPTIPNLPPVAPAPKPRTQEFPLPAAPAKVATPIIATPIIATQIVATPIIDVPMIATPTVVSPINIPAPPPAGHPSPRAPQPHEHPITRVDHPAIPAAARAPEPHPAQIPSPKRPPSQPYKFLSHEYPPPGIAPAAQSRPISQRIPTAHEHISHPAVQTHPQHPSAYKPSPSSAQELPPSVLVAMEELIPIDEEPFISFDTDPDQPAVHPEEAPAPAPAFAPPSPRLPGAPLPNVTRVSPGAPRTNAPPRMSPVAPPMIAPSHPLSRPPIIHPKSSPKLASAGRPAPPRPSSGIYPPGPARPSVPVMTPSISPSIFAAEDRPAALPNDDLPVLFAEELISERSLDEVILAFLSSGSDSENPTK